MLRLTQVSIAKERLVFRIGNGRKKIKFFPDIRVFQKKIDT